MIVVAALDAVSGALDLKDEVARGGLLGGGDMLEGLVIGVEDDILGGGSDQNIVGGLDGGVVGVTALVNGDELLADDVDVALAVIGGVDGVDALDDLGDEELGDLPFCGRQSRKAALPIPINSGRLWKMPCVPVFC